MSKTSDNRNIRVLQFLDAYEKQESLWNPSLESYKNKSARDEAYMNIIRELNVPSLTIHDVKLKVKSIRTTYTKELRLLTKHKLQGKPYNPKLFWFNRANSFLRNVSLSRDKRQNLTGKLSAAEQCKPCVLDYITDISGRQSPAGEVLESTGHISNAEEDPGNTSSSTYEYKTLRNNELEAHIVEDIAMVNPAHVEESAAAMRQAQQLPDTACTKVAGNLQLDPATALHMTCNSPASKTARTARRQDSNHNGDDDYDLFCRSVAAQLRSISDTYSRSVAKLKIQQILFEAETGHYRNSPCITIPVSQHISSV